ncbi:MAG TPA: murein biosynthesis integral membrane protein MurJ [Humisphaera sp.]|jgi:putative peptidoglycan lipid II flippase|nr:murein biosynthesis integral membrane protein MurJ [Humisphaera sp.]
MSGDATALPNDQTVTQGAAEAPPSPANSASTKSFLGHAKLIGGLTLISRFAGLGREIIAGHFMGAQAVAGAFSVAFTIPNLFRKLFGEGALSAAFIPLYAQAVKNDGAESANAFASAAVNLLCIILLGITIVGEAILAALIWSHFAALPETLLMLRLTAIMLPYVLLICGTAFLSGILQVHKRFGAPAAAPIILNVCHMAVLLVGAKILHLKAHTPTIQAEQLQTTLSYWLAAFVLVAGILQFLTLLPALRASGFRFQPVLHFWTPAIRKMLLLTAPVAIGAGVLQLSVLLDKAISFVLMQGETKSHQLITHFSFMGHLIRYPMEAGAPRRLEVAQFLYQFPLGIFAIALATAIFPSLSSDALEKDRNRFRSVLRQGIEASLWEGLPASLGLILVRGPAVKLLFLHGQINAHQADLIAQSVFFYAGAIWAFSVLQIVNRAYYAVHDTVTPLVMSIVNIVINLIVEIPLLWWLGESAMAVGTLVSFAIQAAIMLYMLDRRIGGLNLRGSVAPVVKMFCATVVMGMACVVMQHLPIYPRGNTRGIWTSQLALIIGTGSLVYLLATSVMGVNLMGKLRSRAS